jgi:hypothetical protein
MLEVLVLVCALGAGGQECTTDTALAVLRADDASGHAECAAKAEDLKTLVGRLAEDDRKVFKTLCLPLQQ